MKTHNTYKKNITVTLVMFITCATMMVPLHVYGESSDDGSSAGIVGILETKASEAFQTLTTKLPLPTERGIGAQRTAEVFINSVYERYNQNKGAIESLEKDYNRDCEKAKTDNEKRKITDKYLKERGSIVKRTLNDFEHAKTEFKKTTDSLNTILGDVNKNKSLLDAVAQDEEKIKVLTTQIDKLEQEYLTATTTFTAATPGTPEYMMAYEAEDELYGKLQAALIEFDSIIFLKNVCATYAKRLNLNSSQMIEWLRYIKRTGRDFDNSITILKSVQTANEYAIMANNLPDTMHEVVAFAKIAEEIKGFVEGLQTIPVITPFTTATDEINSVGPIDAANGTRLVVSTSTRINLAERRARIEEKLNKDK